MKTTFECFSSADSTEPVGISPGPGIEPRPLREQRGTLDLRRPQVSLLSPSEGPCKPGTQP